MATDIENSSPGKMRYSLIVVLSILSLSVQAQDYSLRYQTTDGSSADTVYIWKANGDSLCEAVIRDKQGTLHLQMNEPGLITVSVNFSDAGAKRFYIDETGIDATVDHNANTLRIQPTSLNTERDSFILATRHDVEQFERRAFAAARQARSMNLSYDSLMNNMSYIEKAYDEWRYIRAMSAPASYLSLECVFTWTINGEMDRERLLALFHKLGKGLQKYHSYKLCKMVLEDGLKKYQVGDAVASYDLIDAGRSKKNIRDLVKGKLTYIDLWAMGCHASRDAHRTLDSLHAKNRDQVQFISICDETFPDDLKMANIQDKITWLSLYDPEGHLSQFLYQIGAGYTPYGVLIDKEGKIIAKDLRPESLESELKVMCLKP